MVTTRRRATYADIEALPEHLVGEILAGELVVSPRPATPHAIASSAVSFDVMGPFQRGRGGPGGWWILPEPELHLGRDVVVPDLAGWRSERMPTVPSAPFLTLAPDWVCEIASPSTARHDRTSKPRIYARAEVGFMWIVDPLARTLEIFTRDRDHWSFIAAHATDEKVRAVPFDAVELDLAGWWLPEDPAPESPPP
ncbi:MAG: Uma2 family endonuclease [Deltaproteobacteria bacterium]|nr:Uma2 family endonuclease [Deltaproteobacteria bacterium]